KRLVRICYNLYHMQLSRHSIICLHIILQLLFLKRNRQEDTLTTGLYRYRMASRPQGLILIERFRKIKKIKQMIVGRFHN
ncbi:MAG: hypothetical protein J6P82_05085, partial [Bacteroidales bacterium]|nr:hypothetical protein [Bacteroidales bacterium]